MRKECSFVLLMFLVILAIFSAVYSGTTDSAYAQTVSLPPSSQEVTPFKKWYDEQKEMQHPSNDVRVNITSPTTGQKVPVGELKVSGTSTDNATTDCQVLVDVNDMKPYQKAVATGPDGRDDYSSWSFKYTDAYHLITEGSNELTAKLSCSDKDIKPKWHSVNITGVAKKPAPGNILFTTLASNESSTLLSNKTQQGSLGEEQKLKIVNPGGVNKTTNSTDSPYPDVLLEEESTNATNDLSTAGDQKLGAIKEPSPVKVKEATTTSSTDSPYPDVLLEEESTDDKEDEVKEEVKEEPEMQPQQQGQQDEQQQLSIKGDEKPRGLKVKEATAKDMPDILLKEGSTDEKEDEVKEEVKEEPEMKPPLQIFDTDNERKVLANEQWQEGQTDGRVMDSAEDTYTTIMQNIEDGIPSGSDMH
jgi:hypothetical protein